jgi:hypothetical protein
MLNPWRRVSYSCKILVSIVWNRMSYFSYCSRWPKQGQFLIALLLIFGTPCFVSESYPQYGPFAELPGSWSGEGTVEFDDGKQERITCKAFYIVAANGNRLRQSLLCSGSFNINLESSITCRGGVLSGRWREENTSASGELKGRAGGGRFEMSVRTEAFDAKLLLMTYGNVQSVNISSSQKMREISIRLVRSTARN